jgi:hypothetical protein
MGRHNIPIYRPPSGTTARPPSGGGSSAPSHSSSTPSGGGKPKGGSSSSGGSDPYKKYLAQQRADQKKQQRKASTRYLEQAQTLGKQAAALRLALSGKGFRSRLEQGLRNVGRAERITDRATMHDYRERVDMLEQADEDNTKAAAAASFGNLQNRGRERANAMSEAMANGAGESDVLRAQAMSLSNWQANQQEVNRSFFDTQTSINSSLTDLNADTRTARVNNALQADADRNTLWNGYYDQRSEALTNLGNTYGQMAEYFGMAKEQDGRGGKKQKRFSALSGAAFRRAALATGQSWQQPKLDKDIRQWKGHRDFEGEMNNGSLSSSTTELSAKKPEGAKLRSWDA